MKNVTLCIFLSLFMLSSISFSQGYVKLGGGYNLDFNSVNYGSSSTTSGDVTSYEAVNGSFGKGVNIAGAFGYNLSSSLGLELGLIYKLPQEFERKNQYSDGSSNTRTATGSFFAFAPTLVITAPSKNVKPFAKIGLIIALPSVEEERNSIPGSSGGDAYSTKTVFSSGVDFGLIGGAGILAPLSKNIDFIAELDFVSLTWKPSEYEYTDEDGRTTTYKLEDEYSSTDLNTEGPEFLPFSNVGLNIGIQIGF